jgi:hypothetical protein
LRAAFPSLFSYCVTRLGFSEDVACRRIDVARLARRHPALFPLLASGELSLSVVALLKHQLSQENAPELLSAVAGKTVQQAREVLAAHFPQPDTPSRVRKLPERAYLQPAPVPNGRAQVCNEAERVAPTQATSPPALASQLAQVAPASAPTPSGTTRPAQRIAPLAPARYKVELTADAELKAKLELARDLMRHANPSGDFAPILSRALDLLIAEVEKRRFGARSKRTSAASTSSSKPAPASSPYVPRPTRRKVAARDGLRCCWTDETGRRCNSRAWLEHDHEIPRGKGGDSEEGNVRLFRRAHNRLEAERQFGRQHVEHAIARARHARRKRREERASEESVDPDG